MSSQREQPEDREGSASGRGAERPPGRLAAFGLASAIFLALALAFLFVPQWILVELPGLGRSTRVWLATAWVGAAFVAAGYAAWRAGAPR